MRCVVLAGGKGKRLGSLGALKPKPLAEVGGKPLLWYVLNHAAEHGVRDAIIAAGHLAGQIEAAVPLIAQDLPDAMSIRVIDTGEETSTGGRLKRISSLIGGEESVLVTYSDGISDVDLVSLFRFHASHGKLATITAVNPPSPFGWLDLDGDACVRFREKPVQSDAWINAGYFVVHRRAFDLIEGDGTAWEREPVETLASMGELMAYRHHGYWSCVDNVKDIERIEREIAAGRVPWAVQPA